MPDGQDAQLVHSLVENDTDALRTLYGRCGSMVFGMAYRAVGFEQATT